MLIALALHFGSLGIAARAMAAVLFVVLTAPVAAHVIGRAAYDAGEPLWEKTVADELGRPRDRGEPPRDRMPREAEVAAPHGS
jgi:multicomponent Na+:H+ antiporter subunit G